MFNLAFVRAARERGWHSGRHFMPFFAELSMDPMWCNNSLSSMWSVDDRRHVRWPAILDFLSSEFPIAFEVSVFVEGGSANGNIDVIQ